LQRTKADEAFRGNWELVQEWSEQSRYGRHLAADARELVTAVGDRYHGIIAWIRPHW
jgi:hypothetical protein